ncbi:ATPase, T2SS/T4P/T4SS family [Pseudoalteromonas sp. B193]
MPGEVIDMLQAMNCGYQGSMTTIHANSANDAVIRLSTLVQLHNAQLSDTIQVR